MPSSKSESGTRGSHAHGTQKATAALKCLGVRIRELRKAAALTQEQAVGKSALDDKHWSDMERGVTNPTVATLVAVAASLDVELYELFYDAE